MHERKELLCECGQINEHGLKTSCSLYGDTLL